MLASAVALAVLHAVLVAIDVLPHYDALLHVPVVATLVWALRGRPLAQRRWLIVGYLLVFAGALYTHQLTTGYAGRHALVGGVVPWSDAQGLLTNAWRAMQGLP